MEQGAQQVQRPKRPGKSTEKKFEALTWNKKKRQMKKNGGEWNYMEQLNEEAKKIDTRHVAEAQMPDQYMVVNYETTGYIIGKLRNPRNSDEKHIWWCP